MSSNRSFCHEGFKNEFSIIGNVELRKSERIQNLKKRKKNSSSTDVIEPTKDNCLKKIKLSRSKRN